MWVTKPRFSSVDDVQPGLLYAWERDRYALIWRARVWCLRETAPGFPGPDFRGTVVASRVAPRDPRTHWSVAIDGALQAAAAVPAGSLA
ncbi:hypothetical protein ASG36_20590 [Geodermatophilus sp. Leaf369]|nr:hypothetical protein ASG36_20590 [Geodermatophilus sp. Leaf369]KQS64313.1 hypothetical protein ASG41_16830 [Modestobacter sp. Leaf380]